MNPIATARATHALELGSMCITPAAPDALAVRSIFAGVFLTRHVLGDFGDLDEHDLAVNHAAIAEGGQVLSSYVLSAHADDQAAKLWVITDADRSVTTVLLPSDY